MQLQLLFQQTTSFIQAQPFDRQSQTRYHLKSLVIVKLFLTLQEQPNRHD
jgi:hypothetical protein